MFDNRVLIINMKAILQITKEIILYKNYKLIQVAILILYKKFNTNLIVQCLFFF